MRINFQQTCPSPANVIIPIRRYVISKTGKAEARANLPTNRRVSQCSLICLVAANEIIATGPGTVISMGCLLSPKLSLALSGPRCHCAPALSFWLERWRAAERRREDGKGKRDDGRTIERRRDLYWRLPEGIGRKIAGKLASRISL